MNPEEKQRVVLPDILKHAKNRELGRKADFSEIRSVDDFKKKVPISTYNDYKHYVERLKTGEEDILFYG